jgi:hypothetical protein
MATPAVLNSGSPRANWFSRNWKWAAPLGIFGSFFLLASFVGSIFLLVETSFQHSDCYQQTLARVRTSPEIAQKIGEPLKVGWLASGSINTSNSSGNADISIPISGPKGEGTIYMVAKKSAGLWKFETLQVEVKGETARIDLLQPQEEKTREVN